MLSFQHLSSGRHVGVQCGACSGTRGPSGRQTALGNGAGGIQKDAFADAVQRARLIAAKIGGDAGPPPMNNNTASDGFPFTAQKRQLEDAAIGAQLAALGQQRNARRLLDEIVSRGRGTPPSSYHESTNGQSGTVHEMMIPAGKAGLGPNVDKPLRIIGDPYKVQQAQEMVQDVLRERDHGGFNERNDFSARMGGGMDIPIPRHSVGVVIGRNGEMIKKIQNDAGVRIQFKQDDGTGPNKIAHISGPPDCCDHASQIINDLLQSIRVRDEGQGGPPGPPGMPAGNRGRGGGQSGWGPPGGEMTFSIPAHKCGLVIGRGGENVKSINQQTGAFVEICRQPPPNGDPNFKIFIIRGSPQQIDHAKQLIEEKIEIPLCPVGPGPGGPGPGGPGGPMGPYNPDPYNPGPCPDHHSPHQYPPQGWSNTYQQWQPQGPHDPSKAAANDPNAAWAAYYAQCYHQPPGGGPAQNPATPAGGGAQPSGEQTQPAQTPGGQPDYSKAWEEYYKQMGRRLCPCTCCTWRSSGGDSVHSGGEPDYSAAWAEYYRQQASYYGQTGQAAVQPAAPQQGQVGTERGFILFLCPSVASDTEVCFHSI
ncbi:hypothetical protein F7725_003547 [Dissostichus mawsoni]|uniref:K Homology domain-containing protein n=1 Tax=Dissostichus mawsoni TaxID=36200 RepID=A0A7J5YCH9_DISMA|nr:hypothetical protein F7725_003547 [Dissostichus mawsoni]